VLQSAIFRLCLGGSRDDSSFSDPLHSWQALFPSPSHSLIETVLRAFHEQN
jgi:hypothetical protein